MGMGADKTLKPKNNPGLLPPLLGLIVWTAFVLPFAGFFDIALYRQLRTAGYPSVLGKVDIVDTIPPSGDDDSPTPNYHYHYEVAGKTYHAQTTPASCSCGASSLTPGSWVRVYYNPANPNDASLTNTTSPFDWTFPLFLTFFVLPLFYFARTAWRSSAHARPLPDFRILDRGTTLRITPSWATYADYALGGLMCSSLALGIYHAQAGFTGLPALGLWNFLALPLLALAFPLARFTWIREGKSDFLLDRLACTLTTPTGRHIPLADIASISINHTERSDSEGGKIITDEVLLHRHSTPTPLPLKKFHHSPTDADHFANLLRSLILTPQPARGKPILIR